MNLFQKSNLPTKFLLASRGALEAQAPLANSGYNFLNHVTIVAEYEPPLKNTFDSDMPGMVAFMMRMKWAKSAKAWRTCKYFMFSGDKSLQYTKLALNTISSHYPQSSPTSQVYFVHNNGVRCKTNTLCAPWPYRNDGRW